MANNISFYKMQATGNDFVFFSQEEFGKIKGAAKEVVSSLCQRHAGIGADGLIVMQKKGKDEFSWIYYNADGIEASMCGNAARCATIFAQEVCGAGELVTLQTKVGVVRGCRGKEAQDIKISFDLPEQTIQTVERPFGGDFAKAHIVNVGVPHAVIPVTDPWGLRERAKELSRHIFSPEFGAGGGNLTFVQWSQRPNDQQEPILAVTLERGVNDFTLSCGTGVLAVATVYNHLFVPLEKIKVQMPGGILCASVFQQERKASLEGKAQIVFRGVL